MNHKHANLQIIGHFLQAAFERATAFHKKFDVVRHGEVSFQLQEKLTFFLGKFFVGQYLDEVAKVHISKHSQGKTVLSGSRSIDEVDFLCKESLEEQKSL